MFSNKQVAYIEYTEITEDDEHEIFRVRCVLPTFLIPCYSKIVSATSPLRQQDESGSVDATANPYPRARPRVFMPLLSLEFHDRRDAAFHWISQSLQAILDPCPIIERTTVTTAPLDPAWKKRVQHSYKLLVDTLCSSGVPQGVARARDDDLARVWAPRKAASVAAGGRAAHAALGGAQGDEGPDVEE